MSTMSTEIKKVADFYGYEEQSSQLIEECSELIQAVSKYRRATAVMPYTKEQANAQLNALDNLVEEIADVEIMIDQIKYLLQIPAEDIQAVKVYKINRVKERMWVAGRV